MRILFTHLPISFIVGIKQVNNSQHLAQAQCLMKLSEEDNMVSGNFSSVTWEWLLPFLFHKTVVRTVSCVDLFSTCCLVQAVSRAQDGKLQRLTQISSYYEARVRKWLEESMLLWLWSCSTLPVNVKTKVGSIKWDWISVLSLWVFTTRVKQALYVQDL